VRIDEAKPRSVALSANELAGALHEVSNALTVVLGWLEAADGAGDPAKVQAALAVAREHAKRGRGLARRAIGAEDELSLGQRDAQSLVEFAVMSVVPRADQRSVKLEVTAESGEGVTLGDEGPALQILTNLLLNALDFSPPGRVVRVSLRVEPSTVAIVVQDEGPGIPVERHATLFTEALSTRRGGAGIGLAHSRRLARESGGDLSLLHAERGASFELTWPVLASASAVKNGESSSSILVGARILVVEDDAAIASLLELSLEARGAEVVVASDGQSLERILSGRPLFDAALLDLSPLGERLVESIDAIVRESPRASILLVSGQPTGIPPEAEGRFAAWVRKPFEMSELVETLTSLLSHG
jgi:CheY-like chemotaxis protein